MPAPPNRDLSGLFPRAAPIPAQPAAAARDIFAEQSALRVHQIQGGHRSRPLRVTRKMRGQVD